MSASIILCIVLIIILSVIFIWKKKGLIYVGCTILAIIVLILIRPQSPVSKIKFKVEQIKLLDSIKGMEITVSTATDIISLFKKFGCSNYHYTCTLKNKLPTDTLLLLSGSFRYFIDDKVYSHQYYKKGNFYYFVTTSRILNIDMNKTDISSMYIYQNYDLHDLECVSFMPCWAYKSLIYQNYYSKAFILNLDTITWR